MSKKTANPKIRKIIHTDILPIVYQYLLQIGLDSVAKKLLKKSELDLENNVILQKK